jgi:hypothetical protein
MKKLAVAFALTLVAVTAQARSGYKTDFNNLYGTAGSALDSCNLCHGSSTSSWNAYGNDLMTAGNIRAGTQVSSSVITTALKAIESKDSDGDTFSNITEITARTFPGDATSKPVTTVTYCADADKDGYYAITASCTLPAGAPASADCNDAAAAVNPGAAEVCGNGLDDNCNGLVDSADSACPAPAVDYDITGLSVTGTIALRKTAQVNVTVALAAGSAAGSATLNVTATTTTSRGRTKTVQIATGAVVSAAGTTTFNWKPSASGTWTVVADVVDASAGAATGDSATTTVVVP